jgi:chromosome segregation ATPase
MANSRQQEQIRVLEHRIESAEADRQQWQRRAEQLEEILDNERAKLKQLKQKLDVAESGPDKVGKKEVYFWRSRAEKFDAESAQYKQLIVEINKSLQQAEDDLREERECTVNLSELANERREQISELSEKLEEALERYEEAQWHLNHASRFSRLVVRRRTIIAALIKTVRTKQKSNVALKAGLDGLRKFKATAEQQQQKLLMQIDEIKTRLKATEHKLSEQKSLVESKDNTITALTAEMELQASESAANDATDTTNATDTTGIRERDSQIGELNRTIRDQEKEIARLNEAVAGWQKKYEFVSTDTPSTYAAKIAEK